MENTPLLESHVFRDISKIMTDLYGAEYAEYRKNWNDPHYFSSQSPLHLDIDLQDACNQNCAMCHQSYRNRTNQIIPEEILHKAISELHDKGLRSVNIGASSESLLNKNRVLAALNVCDQYNIMDTFLHTNGLLLTADMSEALVSCGLKHICISLDAATPETYYKMRCSNSLDRVENNLLKLIQIRGGDLFPHIRVSFCVTDINKHEKDSFYEKWNNKVDLIDFQEYSPVTGSIPGEKTSRSLQKSCSEGTKRCALWPDGTVSACCLGTQGITFGNLHEEPFHDIWNSNKAKKIRQQLAKGEFSSLCRMCFNYSGNET